MLAAVVALCVAAAVAVAVYYEFSAEFNEPQSSCGERLPKRNIAYSDGCVDDVRLHFAVCFLCFSGCALGRRLFVVQCDPFIIIYTDVVVVVVVAMVVVAIGVLLCLRIHAQFRLLFGTSTFFHAPSRAEWARWMHQQPFFYPCLATIACWQKLHGLSFW